MITLEQDRIVFRFPDTDPDVSASIALMRTLRIPDDGKTWPLPPGLGRFPLRHLDDHASRLPEAWARRGGLIAPIAQAEAMWLHFSTRAPAPVLEAPADPQAAGWIAPSDSGGFPVAVRISTGKIDAVTGEPWSTSLSDSPQNYMVLPNQPWLDGYKVSGGDVAGAIRQFVAMPLGAGYTAEEQLTGAAEHGGLQILVYPMKRARWEAIKAERRAAALRRAEEARRRAERTRAMASLDLMEAEPMAAAAPPAPMMAARAAAPMGLAPGGRMTQEIYRDRYGIDSWDTTQPVKLFVTLLNTGQWEAVTGEAPPPSPATAEAYTNAGLPWFDWYAPGEAALGATPKLTGLKSINEVADAKGDVRPAESAGKTPLLKKLLGPRTVRGWTE